MKTPAKTIAIAAALVIWSAAPLADEAGSAAPVSMLEDAGFPEKWPEGSIKDRAAALRALDEIDERRDALAREVENERDLCIDRFLVQRCWDKVSQKRRGREREMRAVEIAAKDFIRAEDAAAEKRRQIIARIEAGEKVSAEEREIAGTAPVDRTATAAKRLEDRKEAEAKRTAAENKAAAKKANEKSSEAAYRERHEELERKNAAAADDARAAEARVASAEETKAKAEEREAKAEEKRQAVPGELAASEKRDEEAKKRMEESRERGLENQKKREERRRKTEEDRQQRLDAQRQYEEEMEKRRSSINPFM